ncbi:expansin-like B1 isoform X1 [Canna indica]|uniref:Expansin-like B1 isoform X1 n=1 Tax=Canna indica TaxID=4628 RepID=A0AAQ3KCE7_9LILI|nr:expansin-like B1 isoform X1 [Canna indica]
MALCAQLLFFLYLLQFQHLARADSCSGCFTQSSAAYYPNSDTQGTESGACEYGTFGATLNGGDVSAASNLYKNGVGCGACYQVRCTNAKYCSDNGVTIVITDLGSSGDTDFILSQHAFARMGQTADAGASLLSLGHVGVEYRRVSCSYSNKNITFKIDQSSNFPFYFAFQIWYQQGSKDIIAVQLCNADNLTCKLMERSHGAVWAAVPPSGPLSVRMLLSGGDDGDETWVLPPNNIPQNWTAGATYDSGIQV